MKLKSDDNTVWLGVKVVPGASRTRYLGEWENRARIAVSAPPEKGKANKALITFIARKLGVRKVDVQIVSGETNNIKTIRIEQVHAEKVISAFQPDRS